MSEVSFQQDAHASLSQLKQALAGVLAAFPQPVRRYTDLRRQTTVAASGSWQIYRAATAPDAFAVGLYLPKTDSLAKFLKDASKRGVARKLVIQAEEAYKRVETMVEEHAGDREVFSSMIGDLTSETDDSATARHRRAAFRANTHLYGRFAESTISASILLPSMDGLSVDQISINGWVQLQQVRIDAPMVWEVRNAVGSAVTNPNEYEMEPVPSGTMVDLGEEDGKPSPLLLEFCSKPLPKIERIVEETHYVSHRFTLNHPGRKGAATIHMAWLRKKVDTIERLTNLGSGFSNFPSGPLKMLQRDIFVSRSLIPEAFVKLEHYRYRQSVMPTAIGDPLYQLSCADKIVPLGPGLAAWHSVDVPQYSDIIASVLSRVGASANDFTGFRLRVEYPVPFLGYRLHLQPMGKPSR